MRTLPLLLALIALPAFGQTMYKCPSPAGTINFNKRPVKAAKKRNKKAFARLAFPVPKPRKK